MGVITRPYTFVSGNTILAAENNSNETTIYNEFNGNIENANIKSTAAIAESKLSLVRTFTSKTAAYTLTSSDDGLTCDASGGAFTVTLPTASGIVGKEYIIYKNDSSANAVTVDGDGSETINGATTYLIRTQYGCLVVKSDGTNWGITSSISTYPSFSVHKNGTNQTGIVTATWTKLTWSTEEWDTNSNFASDKFTPTVEGYYFLNISSYWASDVDGSIKDLALYKNGSLYTEWMHSPSSSSASLPIIVYANGSSDYFEVYVKQVSGSDKIIDGSASYTYFRGHKLP